MVSMYLSRIIMLVFGTLYPAYRSYKAIKNKEVREYVKWMMYWIVFAFFTTAETFADIFISWLPLYYEIKIVFIIWLLSPATKGSSILYRRFVHPRLAKHEKQIDKYIDKARENSYATIMEVGRKGLNVAADTVVKTAITGQGALIQTLKRYSSMQELRDTTDAGDNGQSGGNVRASWYGGMLPQSAGGNFDPESDADFLQKQYDGGDRRSAGEIIHEEHGLYKSASAESLAYQHPPSASQPPSPSSSYVGSVGSADSAMRVDDRVPYDAMTLPRLYSSRPGADGGESHLSDPEVRTDSTFSYSSATLPKMRRSKAPLYESNPVMNAARASRHRRGRDKSDRS